jgi:tyrosine phenol-lyase
MAGGVPDVSFSVPYEIAVVRPLRQTTLSERDAALRAAHFNTELIPQEAIYIDLSTDSGVSAVSTEQFAALTGAKSLEPGMGLAAEASAAFARLAEQIQACFGFSYFIPTTQGRSAERIWAKLNVKPNSVVAGNMLFPSTRAHIEMNGAKIIDVIDDAAHDLTSDEPFKGNIDLKKLETVLHEQGPEKVSCIYVELSVNSCGGHPVSLANLRKVKTLAGAARVPLFLDSCRILENSYLIQEREAVYGGRTIREIALETCALADGCTMSALKDFLVPAGGLILTRDKGLQQKAYLQSFLDGAQPPASVMEMMATALAEIFSADAHVRTRAEQVKSLWRRLKDSVPVVSPAAGHAVFVDVRKFLPHLAAEQFPAEALAAFLYRMSGIRATKGPPLAPSQVARGTDLLRLAIPARKYLPGHLDDVAAALVQAYAHRNDIKGLRRVHDPSRSKYEPAHYLEL